MAGFWRRPPSFEPIQDTVTQVRRGANPVSAFLIGALDSALGRMMAGTDGSHVIPATGLGFSITGKATGELGALQPGVTGVANLDRNWNQKPGLNRALPNTNPTAATPPSALVDLLDQTGS